MGFQMNWLKKFSRHILGKPKPRKHYKRWSKEEDDKLLSLKDKGLSDFKIAERMGRSFRAVRQRSYRINNKGNL